MVMPEHQVPERAPSKVLLIIVRIWPCLWGAMFGSLLLFGLNRPHKPDPAHGFTEKLKAFPGIVFVSPTEIFAFNCLVALIFALGIFVILPVGVWSYLENRKRREA